MLHSMIFYLTRDYLLVTYSDRFYTNVTQYGFLSNEGLFTCHVQG